MKILFVSEKFPPLAGGGETHLEQLASGLARFGHEVCMATDRLGDASPDIRRDGVRIRHLPGLAQACSTLTCHVAVPSMFELLAGEAADILHVVNSVPALLLGWLRPAIRSAVIFSSFETLVPDRRVFGLFENFPLETTLQRSILEILRPDLQICGSALYERWARTAGSRALATIPHATDVDQFAFDAGRRQRFRGSLGWLPEDFVFLVPARPLPRKRIEDVLAAAARLAAHRVQVAITTPEGRYDTTYLAELQRQAQALGLADRLHWVRGLGWRDMPALYAACDAAILPSSNEGFGIAILEAMAAERPVIATRIEGPDEFLEAEAPAALTYPAGDIDALCALMADVMSGDMSSMTRNALELVRTRYGVDTMVRRHVEAYERVLGHADDDLDRRRHLPGDARAGSVMAAR